MPQLQKSDKAIVETILIAVVLLILGFTGWYVWHARQNTDKTLSDTSKSTPAIPVSKAASVTNFAECKAAAGSILQETYPEKCVTKAGKTFTDASADSKLLVIKEWGVQIPYTSTDTLSYKVETTKVVQVISANLAGQYGCTAGGAGSIGRTLGSDYISDEHETVAQEYQQSHDFTKVGNYYFNFAHDQAACSATVTVDAQNSVNSFVQSILPNIEEVK